MQTRVINDIIQSSNERKETMTNIAQFRQYVNKYGYFHNGKYMIDFDGKSYPVSAIWNLINMGLFKNT